MDTSSPRSPESTDFGEMFKDKSRQQHQSCRSGDQQQEAQPKTMTIVLDDMEFEEMEDKNKWSVNKFRCNIVSYSFISCLCPQDHVGK